MANEEIEISELEYTEEVAPDNLIPIESVTDTKATSLQVLRDWFKSFFVSKTGDEAINGFKTFMNNAEIRGDGEPYILLHIPNKFYGRLCMTDSGMASKKGDGSALQQFYAGASATINTVITTTGISKAGNGYVKMGNGIVIQWGHANNISGNTTITLPTAFNSNNYSVTLGLNESVDSYASSIVSKTNTNFVYRANSNRKSYWIAIGY